MSPAAPSSFPEPPEATATVRPVAVRPASSRLDPVVFWGVFGMLLFAPLALGAVEPWSTFVLEAGAALLFTLWVLRQVQRGELSLSGNPVFLPMLAFGAITAIQLAFSLTAYRYVTIFNVMLYAAYALLAFLVVQILRRTAQVKSVAILFSAYGAAVALFALVQNLSGTSKLYWTVTPELGGWIYGPYVNHNHYAGLMEMLVPVPLVVALGRHRLSVTKILAASAAALMASTIFLSGSRGGMAALIVELLLLAIILSRREKKSRIMIALAVFLAVVAGMLIWLGGGALVQRVTSIHTEARTEVTGGTRLAIDRDGLRMFARKPLLGWGLGTFPEVYPQYRSFYTNFFVNQAHNDYVQLLVETGALGFAVMLWLLVAVYRGALPKLAQTDTNSGLTLAALMGVTGILVHSFVDFNLQIPANAALFYVLCAVAAMEPRLGQFQRRTRERTHTPLDELSPKTPFQRFLERARNAAR